MKTKQLLILLLLLTVKAISAQSLYEKWPEMKSFHEVMSQTFHPAEEGNFEPINARSDEMMHKAAYLLKSNIPEEYRTKAIFEALEKLQNQSSALNQLIISKSTNEQVFISLSQLHDTFHVITGLCND